MKIGNALRIVKMMKNPHEYFLAHFGRMDIKDIELRNGMKIKGDNIGELYSIFSAPYEYDTSMLRDPSVIVDMGACIGGFTLFVANKFKEAKVYAYEPNPKSFKSLCQNIDVNKLNSRVILSDKAIAGDEGEVALSMTNGLGSSILGDMFGVSTGWKEVPSTTLSKVIEELGNIDYLKMDIEGAEYEVLLNTPKILLDKVRVLAIEYHPIEGRSYKELIKYLSDRINLNHIHKPDGFGIYICSTHLKQHKHFFD